MIPSVYFTIHLYSFTLQSIYCLLLNDTFCLFHNPPPLYSFTLQSIYCLLLNDTFCLVNNSPPFYSTSCLPHNNTFCLLNNSPRLYSLPPVYCTIIPSVYLTIRPVFTLHLLFTAQCTSCLLHYPPLVVVEVLLYGHRNRRLIRDGEPRTSTSTFTQLLSSDPPFFNSFILQSLYFLLRNNTFC